MRAISAPTSGGAIVEISGQFTAQTSSAVMSIQSRDVRWYWPGAAVSQIAAWQSAA